MVVATRIGIIGCGRVSHMYIPTLRRCPAVQIAGVADVDPAAGKGVAERYGLPPARSPEDLLADPTVAIIVNLTPIAVHVEVTRAALARGKHVYSEKALATTLADAQGILADAAGRDLAVGCAPDTLLWSGFQAAREALRAGRVGRPISATAAMYRRGFTAPSFYTDGPFPFYDMAPYYLSALVTLFGPAVRVRAATRTCTAGEVPVSGTAGAPIMVCGVLEFAGGAVADLTLAWATEHRSEISDFRVFGSSGILAFPNPNGFGGPAHLQRYGEPDWQELPGSRAPAGERANLRGIGVAEMAIALRAGRQPRASGELAAHVVDIIGGLVESGRGGTAVDLTTTCAVPEAVTADARMELYG